MSRTLAIASCAALALSFVPPVSAQSTGFEVQTSCGASEWNLRYGVYREFYKPVSRIMYNEFSAILDGDQARHGTTEAHIDMVSAPFRLMNLMGAKSETTTGFLLTTTRARA